MPHSTRIPSNERCVLEPVAICGMACRLPGDVDSASSLWDMLVQKRSGQMDKVPETRFNIDAHYHENLDRPGSFNVRGGYFIDGRVDDFDPTLFNITPVEAQWLDPQQRKMLEVSYECLESAGLSLDAVSGSNTAVFVGSFTSDYQQMSIKDPDFRHNYAATGVDPGIISNRIGNTFNLVGPSFTINTACSSSVYAIHSACHALRSHDCDAAIAGGVNLILTVDQHMNTAKLGILSPTSTCHTFDAAADGYGRAEGAGALYLKRLSDAIQDGDPVRAVIRSTAVNTNGKVAGMGITHPSVEGQERVVRKAYQRACLDPSRTAYAELHGTGTPVGDPIEVRAVSSAMNDTRSLEKPLLLGAIKPNIGHSEAASGIFAVMKAALMTEAGVVPGVAHFQRLNPAILEEDWNVKVHSETAPWPSDSPIRRCSVSSFGYGGTNGHVIVEAANVLHPSYKQGVRKGEADYNHATTRPLLLCFSAHDGTTLARNIAAIGNVASRYFPADLTYTVNTRRTRFSQGAFTILRDGKEVEAFSEQALSFGASGKKVPRVGYLFTGQGAQWAGMGVKAMSTFPSFHQTIRKLDQVLGKLEPKPSFILEEVLLGKSQGERFNEAEITQPLCTAIQIAIVDLFTQWGVNPAVTVGHSSGEIAAAYAAGLISAPEAIVGAFYRGFAVNRLTSSGSMLAVGLGADAVAKYMDESSTNVVVACENSPNSVTLSGCTAALYDVKKRLDAEKIFARELKTGKAYHSPYMEPVGVIYSEVLQGSAQALDLSDFAWKRPRARMISSVTGEEIYGCHLEASYWIDNLRNRVRFSSAVSALGAIADLSDLACLSTVGVQQIGPHSALSGPFKQIRAANSLDHLTYIPTLVRGEDDAAQLLSTAGSLFLQGYRLDLEAVNVIEPPNRKDLVSKRINPLLLVDLPPYQWNYEKTYWAEPRPSAEQRSLRHPRHDILGSRISGLSSRSKIWRNVLRHRDVPWLQDHRLGNSAVFPAAAHMSLAIEALRQIHEDQKLPFDGVTLREIIIQTALVIPETDDGIEIQLRLEPFVAASESASWHGFCVESILDGQWTSHCEGKITANLNVGKTEQDYKSPVKISRLTQRVSGKRWYDAFSRVGFDYTRSFQQLRSIATNSKHHEAAADIKILCESGLVQGESRYILHPATVDACLQLIIISINAGLHKHMPCGVVPINVDEVNFWFPDGDLDTTGHAVAWTDNFEPRHFNTHAKLIGESGNLIMDIKNLSCVAYEAAVPPKVGQDRPQEPYMESSWKPDISTLATFRLPRLWRALPAAEMVNYLLELLHHKYKLEKVLLLGRPGEGAIDTLLQVIPAAISITIAYITADNMALHEPLDQADQRISTVALPENTNEWSDLLATSYDLIVDSMPVASIITQSSILDMLKSLTKPRGWLLMTSQGGDCDVPTKGLLSSGWSVTAMPVAFKEIVLLCDSTPFTNGVDHGPQDITILSLGENDSLTSSLVEAVADFGAKVSVKAAKDLDPSTDQKIVIPDFSGNLLSEISKETFTALQKILSSPASILWLTRGVKEGQPGTGGMAEGFLRVVRSEHAAARIVLLDFDITEEMQVVGQAVVTRLDHVAPKDSGADTEFWLHGDVLHIDRVAANHSLNMEKSARPAAPETQLLNSGAVLTGDFKEGRLHFKSDSSAPATLLDGQVEIEVKASDLQQSANTTTMVFGQVLRTGPNVGSFFIGKDVIAYTLHAFSTRVQTAVWELADAEIDPLNLLATVACLCPVVNAAIRTAKAENKERILLFSGPAGFTHAFIRLGYIFNWEITVVASNERESQIYQHELGMSAGAILFAHDEKAISDFVQGNAPPKVVIAHEFSTLSKEVWRLMAPTCRFILNDAPIDHPPDVLPFARGASFLTASITALNRQDEKAARELLRLTLSILSANQHQLTAKPSMFDIGEVDLTEMKDVAEGVITYDYGTSTIQIEPTPERFVFSAEAMYLMVGCLGGLGRSLTTWMIEQGAKHFAFISRSGADKPEAAEVIRLIEYAGAEAKVFRADVSNQEEVVRVVKELTSKHQIRGVVHAAMVLKDGIYEKMAAEDFQAAVAPKVKGAQNLDKALQSIDLDFFVMTSSISATLGNPGQSNYSAANSFLDHLAWQRNLRHQVGTSLVLPMVLGVGVVAENEEIEVSLARKAMYGIDEQEMLRGFEVAMSRPRPKPDQPIKMGDAQIILGLEPTELAKSMQSSETADAYWYNDARFCHIRAAVEEVTENNDSPEKSNDFSQTMKAALAESVDAAIEAIAQHVIKRSSSILMVPAEIFEYDGASIASYGLDSMIGAELRTWLFKEFGLDIPFQALLAPTLTFKGLSVAIAQNMDLLPHEA